MVATSFAHLLSTRSIGCASIRPQGITAPFHIYFERSSMRYPSVLSLALIALMGGAACNGSTSTTEPDPCAGAKLEISRRDFGFPPGVSHEISAAYVPVAPPGCSLEIQWNSSNEKVIEITPRNGGRALLTGVGNGHSVVSVTAPGRTQPDDSILVVVAPPVSPTH